MFYNVFFLEFIQVKINFNKIKYTANPDRNKIPDILRIFNNIEGWCDLSKYLPVTSL